jgi:hypothetical protein
MRLVRTDAEFVKNPYLTVPISYDKLRATPLQDFDKDGYEISTPIELEHYILNNVFVNANIQFHDAASKHWYIDKDNSEEGLVLDHTQILHRWAYAGEARERIEEIAQVRPVLNKLLAIKPKWGIDFSLDYVTHEACMEVFHIEKDATTYEEALELKDKAEQIIDNTDWESAIQDILKRKDEWYDLCSDDQSDWKARYFGWHRAFDSKKVYF